MDLATIIIDSAVNSFKDECESKTCDVNFMLRGGRYNYTIKIIPMNKHVMIKYKTLEYKVARENKDDYDSILKFLYGAIADDVNMILSDDIEFTGYWPEDDVEFSINRLEVKRLNTCVFNIQFECSRFEEVFRMYLSTLRNMQ